MARTGFTRRWRVLHLLNPTVGTDWVMRAPGDSTWRIVSLVARLVTDANVANRDVVLRADNQTISWWANASGFVQGAGTTIDYAAFTGWGAGVASGGVVTMALPGNGLLLRPGHRLRPITTNIQVGDQWSLIAALIDEIPSDTEVSGDMVTVDTRFN